jgi:ABC-type branched-subunit amino acid transport system ATPase component
MLLLDEPSSGLDSSETEEFGRAIKLVADQRGCGVLLVEHDMALVRQVCDYVYVMDWGRLIFEGDVDAMVTSEVVRNAYLGSASEVSALPTSPS